MPVIAELNELSVFQGYHPVCKGGMMDIVGDQHDRSGLFLESKQKSVHMELRFRIQ